MSFSPHSPAIHQSTFNIDDVLKPVDQDEAMDDERDEVAVKDAARDSTGVSDETPAQEPSSTTTNTASSSTTTTSTSPSHDSAAQPLPPPSIPHAPLSQLMFEAIPSSFFPCTSALQVTLKFNHVNIPENHLIMQPGNFPKLIAKLIPQKKNAKRDVLIHTQNFHIYLYCWHHSRKEAATFPDRIPRMSHTFVDMEYLYNEVVRRYGYINVCNADAIQGWLCIFRKMPNYSTTITNYTSRLKEYYKKYLKTFEDAHAYFNANPKRLGLETANGVLNLDWEYYMDDPVMREFTLTFGAMESRQLNVDRYSLTLNIGFTNLEGAEESLKKFPPTTRILAGDVFYSYAKKSLVLCYTPSPEDQDVFESYAPYFLVGRLNDNVWENLDTLRTTHLRAIESGNALVRIENLPDPEPEEIPPDLLTLPRTSSKPHKIIKWGEKATDRKRKKKEKRVENKSPKSLFVPVAGRWTNASGQPVVLSSLGAPVGSGTVGPLPVGALVAVGQQASQAPPVATALTTSPEPDLSDMLNMPPSPPPLAPPAPVVAPAPQLPGSEATTTTAANGTRKSTKRRSSQNDDNTHRKKRKVEVAPVPVLPGAQSAPVMVPFDSNKHIAPPAQVMRAPTLEFTPPPRGNGVPQLQPRQLPITAAPVRTTASIATQTDHSFGPKQKEPNILAIRYRFSGTTDQDFRLIPHKLDKTNSEQVIDKARLLQILESDDVPVHQLREMRHYFEGSNPEVRGWMLVNDDFCYRIPECDNMLKRPHLSLKLAFKGVE